MNKIINIAIIGLGQVGLYLYNELRIKKKENLKLIKKFFIVIQLKFLKKKELISYLNVLASQIVYQRKLLK